MTMHMTPTLPADPGPRAGRRTITPGLGQFLAGIVATQPEWMDDALCAQIGGDHWFPAKGDATWRAKSICRRCPVTAECLDYALERGEPHGIWGGISERERRALRRDAA